MYDVWRILTRLALYSLSSLIFIWMYESITHLWSCLECALFVRIHYDGITLYLHAWKKARNGITITSKRDQSAHHAITISVLLYYYTYTYLYNKQKQVYRPRDHVIQKTIYVEKYNTIRIAGCPLCNTRAQRVNR